MIHTHTLVLGVQTFTTTHTNDQISYISMGLARSLVVPSCEIQAERQTAESPGGVAGSPQLQGVADFQVQDLEGRG